MRTRLPVVFAVALAFLVVMTGPVLADKGGVPHRPHDQAPQSPGAESDTGDDGWSSLPGNRRGWWKRLAPTTDETEDAGGSADQARTEAARTLAGQEWSFLLMGVVSSVDDDTLHVADVRGNRVIRDLVEDGDGISVSLIAETLYHACGAGDGWDTSSPLEEGQRVKVLGVVRCAAGGQDCTELELIAQRVMVLDGEGDEED